MLDFPDNTEFNKRIPKHTLYEKLSCSPAIKKVFQEQVQDVWWLNKLTGPLIKVASGKQVSEIEVIKVQIASDPLDTEILRQIDRQIPYHILFLLEHDGHYQAVMGYKEIDENGTIPVLDRYFKTGWMNEKDLPLKIEGDSLDDIYENFVRQIAGDSLGRKENSSLKDSIEEQKQNEMLCKKIAALEAKIKKEKQPRKKFWLVQELRKLKETREP